MNKNDIDLLIKKLLNNKQKELKNQGYEMKEFTKGDIKLITDLFVDSIAYFLQTNGHVSITNFGSFKIKNCKPRESINPKTKKTMYVLPHNKIFFTSGKTLKKAINGCGSQLSRRNTNLY